MDVMADLDEQSAVVSQQVTPEKKVKRARAAAAATNKKPVAITPKGCGCPGAKKAYSGKQDAAIAAIEARVK